ncbi:Similar to Mitochondrial metal transporter 2; acc. no. Q08970 [Pyronema omphalodes CBS 100304]|uniref:Similar to Mitochondrial metal transporter 2 acc. no. Q08970 n=1 Tax=Pyronema omphalodes (strain CBS 100304) TaxID=1076935 RepID=U4L8N6_PYROM|nr:Similar to Mitochondrial metal transporter 2; acc. no. Q08970 [Pyronema omphalodes CBS 100304]
MIHPIHSSTCLVSRSILSTRILSSRITQQSATRIPQSIQGTRTRVLTTLSLRHPTPRSRPSATPFLDLIYSPNFSTSTSTSAKLTTPQKSHHDHEHSMNGHTHSHAHGHGHSHSHGADPYLMSSDTTDPGVRITRIGLMVNLGMVVTKGVGGWVFNSQALVADAFHALTDMVSDIMTLATVSWALKPPTERFPNGYGKVESLGSLGVSSLLLFGGIAMGYGSLVHLLEDFAPSMAGHLPHGHEHSHAIPSLNAAWLALGSIFAKEYLYRATMKIAKAKKSSVLASNAIHHRVDSLTAIVALVAIAGANILPNAGWLDPVGGLMVAAMVVQAGAANTRLALEELVDQGVDGEFKEEVREKVMQVLAEEEVVEVEGIKSGQNYMVTVVVAVEGGKTVKELEEVEDRVREACRQVQGMWKVAVRFVRKGEEVRTEFVDSSGVKPKEE